MEIKTAEEYVVNKLFETEEELAKTDAELSTLEFKYDILHEKYSELKNRVRKMCCISGSDDDIRVSFDSSYWKKYEEKDFDYWTNVFPDLLEEDEEENKDE